MEKYHGIEQHERFVDWRENNPDGYVLNYRTAKDPMLHRACCFHLVFSSDDKARLTRDKKVCSLDWHELVALCVEEYGTKPVPCGHCLNGALPI